MLLISRDPDMLKLVDNSGQLVGTILRPTSDRVAGRGAGTVLLLR